MSPNNKIKNRGEVFTPNYIVKIMLDMCGYDGPSILKKHVMDNSCGAGAILSEVVERYCIAYFKEHGTINGVLSELVKYVHGIEISRDNYQKCIDSLNILLYSKYNLDTMTSNGKSKVKWDIRNTDAIKIYENYSGKIDYVFGNPPYIRTKNMSDDENVRMRSFSFAKNGMSDMYLIFYQLGFEMLSENGKLCYVSPLSWLYSKSGFEMRSYVCEHSLFNKFVDLGSFKPFKGISTYVGLFEFEKNSHPEIYEVIGEPPWDGIHSTGKYLVPVGDNLKYRTDGFAIADSDRNTHKILVKNGLATNADKIYVLGKSNVFGIADGCIRSIKASTGEIYDMIYPYDSDGNLLSEGEFKNVPEAYSILEENKDALIKRNMEKDSVWYQYGRSQAITDVNRMKWGVQFLAKEGTPIKITPSYKGEGVFSGIYVLNNTIMDDIEFGKFLDKTINNESFMAFVKSLRNYDKPAGKPTISIVG